MLLLAPYGRSAAIIIIYYLPTVYSLQLNLHIKSHHGYWHIYIYIYIYPFVGKKAGQNFKVGDITGCKKKRKRKKKKARNPGNRNYLESRVFLLAWLLAFTKSFAWLNFRVVRNEATDKTQRETCARRV